MPTTHASFCECHECLTDRKSARQFSGGGLSIEMNDSAPRIDPVQAFADKAAAIAGGVPAEVFAGEGAPEEEAQAFPPVPPLPAGHWPGDAYGLNGPEGLARARSIGSFRVSNHDSVRPHLNGEWHVDEGQLSFEDDHSILMGVVRGRATLTRPNGSMVTALVVSRGDKRYAIGLDRNSQTFFTIALHEDVPHVEVMAR